jgi:hypothetical protein
MEILLVRFTKIISSIIKEYGYVGVRFIMFMFYGYFK